MATTLTQDPAPIVNCVIPRNADFRLSLIYKDSTGALFDLTGATAKLQFRKLASDAAALISLTNGSGLTLGGTAGTIDIASLAAANTALAAGTITGDLVVVKSGATYLVARIVATVADGFTT